MTDLQPAARELATLAAAMRSDWGYDETLAAIFAAGNAGWDFEHVFREVGRLLVQRDGAPSSLRFAARNAQGVPGPRETTYSEGAAKARQALGLGREDGAA